ncbi:MAG: hypothetical protein ACM3N4_12150 [Nitrososphaerota archaeon]
MLAARSTHYWLWFILFGVISSMVVWRATRSLDSEAAWLLLTGFLGVLTGVGGLSARVGRPYDLIIGMLFMAVGLLGIMHNLGYNVVPADASTASSLDQAAFFGLSLAFPYALIHTLLGLGSLNHGLRARSHSPSVTVETSSHAA